MMAYWIEAIGMSIELQPEFLERVEKAYYMWFTTVRADGMPQPTPVWFVWENGTCLIYTTDQSQKHRNLLANPHVALSYSATPDADDYLVIMGEAAVDPTAPPPNHHAPYLTKYGTGIPEIGMTPESFAQTFSVAIRVTPTHIRLE